MFALTSTPVTLPPFNDPKPHILGFVYFSLNTHCKLKQATKTKTKKMKNTNRLQSYASALAASTAMIGAASAASISWGTFNDDPSAASEISTTGTLHQAVNLVSDGSLAGGTTTVNGVDFADTNLFSNGYAALNPSVDTGDAGLNSLYSSFGYNGGNVSITGLTIGFEYQVQVFYGDNRAGTAARDMVVGTAQPTVQATATENLADGVWVIGTFTADATSQTFWAGQTDSSTVSEISAFQVRQTAVPEPSSAALLGLGGLALIMRRRK